MNLHQTQKIVAEDTHDYRVVCCGRQWGKTTLAVLEMIACAYAAKGKEVAYFATTFDQARNIAWTILKEFTKPVWAKSPNESRLELWVTTQDGGESRITLRGFENVETARGQQFDFLVIDEAAQMKNWDYNWQAVLAPTLAFRKGKALFISTPLGFNHFHEMYVRGQDSTNEYWKSWRFNSYDNPFLPKEKIDQAKDESSESYFAQEYMADFRKFTGLIYKDFQRETHIIEPFDIPEGWDIYRGLDFGSTNPTACLWVGVDGDDNFFVFDEHYQTGETIDYHAGIINARTKRSVSATYGDPSGAQWINEFGQRGIYITPANKETGQSQEGWVRFGIEKVAERLKLASGHVVPLLQQGGKSVPQWAQLGMPRLYVFSSCTNLIRELETYRWKEKAVTQAQDLNNPEQPEKANDHALDALRYIVVSYSKPTKYVPTTQWRDPKAWRIGA